jgi:hypothetical protein
MADQKRKNSDRQPTDREFYEDEQRIATNEGMPTQEEYENRERRADERQGKRKSKATK